jgi:hypothetical protein
MTGKEIETNGQTMRETIAVLEAQVKAKDKAIAHLTNMLLKAEAAHKEHFGETENFRDALFEFLWKRIEQRLYEVVPKIVQEMNK